MAGTIEVIVKLYLDTDVDENEAQEIVDEMGYNFKHDLISDSTIIDYELIK